MNDKSSTKECSQGNKENENERMRERLSALRFQEKVLLLMMKGKESTLSDRIDLSYVSKTILRHDCRSSHPVQHETNIIKEISDDVDKKRTKVKML